MTAVFPLTITNPAYSGGPAYDAWKLMFAKIGAKLTTAGLIFGFRADAFDVAPAGFNGRWNNLLTTSALVATLASTQVGTLTPKVDIGYFGDRKTLEGSAAPTTGDAKATLSNNVWPTTGAFSLYAVVNPFTNTFQVAGNNSGGLLSITIVNDQIRFSVRNSGSGGFTVTATVPSGVIAGKDIIVGLIRTANNFLRIRYKLRGQPWVEVTAAQACTSGAGGTGSALAIASDLNLHSYLSSANYTAYGRHGGYYGFNGDLDAAQTDFPAGLRTPFESHLSSYYEM